MAARPIRPFRFAFVVLSVLALLVASLPVLVDRPAQAKETLGVYASVWDGDRDRPIFSALDPRTLADLEDQPAVDLGDDWRIMAISANGSMFAFAGPEGIVVVRTGLDGPELMRVQPEGPTSDIHLKRDGLRLISVVTATDRDGYLYPTAWQVFDTLTGDVVATVENQEGRNAYGNYVVDADATRLYRLVFPKDDAYLIDGTGARSALLIAYDLTTGAELGRLALPDVIAGGWRTDDAPIAELKELRPAFALSPDGRQFVIAYADKDAITIVDTQRLAVDRTFAVTEPVSRLQRLLGWTGLLPRSAAAKTAAGTLLDGVLSPDGRRLYLYGATWGDDENGEHQPYHGIGLRIIDLETGAIEAKVLDGDDIRHVVPSPNGSDVYVIGVKRARHSHAAVWRLNGETGDIGAQRLFPRESGIQTIFLLPPRSRG